MSFSDIRKKVQTGKTDRTGGESGGRLNFSTRSVTPSYGSAPASRTTTRKPLVSEEERGMREQRARQVSENLSRYAAQQAVKESKDKEVIPLLNQAVREGIAQRAKEGQAIQQRLNETLTPYERWYRENIEGYPIGKVLGGLQRADRAVSDVKAGALDTATFGATQGLGRAAINNMQPNGEGDELRRILQERTESPAYKTGEFLGYIPPAAAIEKGIVKLGGKALANAPRLVRGITTAGAAGAIDALGQETGDVAFREREFDPLNVALGAGAGVAFPLAGAITRGISNKGTEVVKKAFEGLTERQLAALKALDDVEKRSPEYTRLRVNNPNASITAEVTRRITPPTEENALISWLKPHLGASWSQMRKLSREDLDDLARQVSEGMDVDQVTREVVSEMGQQPTMRQAGERIGIRRAFGETADLPQNVRSPIAPEQPSIPRTQPEPSVQAPTSAVETTPIVGEAGAVEAPVTDFGAVRERARAMSSEPTQGKSRFASQTARASDTISDEVKQALGESENLTYTKASNAAQVERANEILNTQGASKAIDDLITKSDSERFTGDDVALAIRSIQDIQKTDVAKAVSMAEILSQRLTKAGQEIQAASIMDRLSPEGQLVRLTRAAQKIGTEVKTTDAAAVRDFAEAAQKSGQSVERSQTVMDISEKLKKGEELSPTELAELHNFVDDMKSYLKPAKPPKEKKVKLPSDKKRQEQILNVLNEKEAQLKEFIRQNSRRVSSTPFDLWGAYAALGAIKLAKGTISFSKWSSEMLSDIGEEIRPKLSQLFDRAQQEADQLERISPTKTQAEKVANRYIEAGNLNQKDAALIHDLAARMGRIGSDDRFAAQREIQAILNKYTKSSLADKLNAIRYINMLGNTGTQLVNAISSPLMLLERQMVNMALTPFDIARSAITGGDRRITFKQGPGTWDNFFTPAVDYVKGAKIGGESGWRGIDPMGITSQTDTQGLAWRSKFNPIRWAEGTLGAVMKGADYASYNTAAKMKLRQMAYLDALNKGVKGKEDIRRYMDRYLNNLDSNIVEMADKFGKDVTFQTKTKAAGAAQSVARGLNRLSTLGASDKIGLGSATIPFTKTPTNILLSGLERTPAGIIKGIHELATMSKNPNITGEDVATTFANALLGTAGLTGTGYVLGNLGILTGDSASKSKDVQALEQDIGQGKFKFNTSAFSRMMGALISGDMDEVREVSKYRPGDKQLNYSKLQPFAFPTAMGATFAEQERQDQAAESRGGNIPLGEQLKSSAISGGQSLFDMSMLKGLKDAFDVQPGEGVGEIVGNLATNYAKSFSPSALAQEQRRQDESQRVVERNNVGEYFTSRSPAIPAFGIEGSPSLPPKVTRMGDTLKNERGIIANYLNPLQRNTPNYNQASQIIYDLIQQTGDETLAPKVFDKTLRVTKNGKTTTATIPPKRYATAQQEVGREITKRVLELDKEKGLTVEEKAKKLEEIMKDVEEEQRDKLKVELGLVVPKVRR